jgi:WD40 repeat protein/serine/threonine protein kinase
MAEELATDQYQSDSRLHEAIASFEQARDAGQHPNPQEWLGRYPEVASQLADFFADELRVHQLLGPLRPEASRVAEGRPAPGDEPETFPDIPGYQILEFIRRGGMGVVYKARQLSADRIVALKVIRPDRLEGLSPEERSKSVERFITEAQAAAKLEHENIVHVYEVGEVRGRPFYSMRYVVGNSLHDLIQQGPLEGRRAAGYLEKVARAVHEAHRHGILHRDLKPHNILVEADGDRPLVADFGLAKLLQGGQGVTATGDVMGTPPYMSPEQVESAAHVTVASDVYSLGATLYALLTGRPPFQGHEPVRTLMMVVEDEPTPPRAINPLVHQDLETICLKCLEKEPAKRYSSAEMFADRLQLFLEGKPIPDRPITQVERLGRWCRRNPMVAALTAAVAFVFVSGTGVATYFAIEADARAREANNNATATLRQRRRADEKAAEAMGRLYISDMRLGQRAWEDNQIGRLVELLDGQRPDRTGGTDLRGFEWYYWWRLCHPDLVRLEGDTRWINSVAYRPDGKRIVGASLDTTVKVWDADTGRLLQTLKGHTNWVNAAAYSPDGQWIISGSHDHTLKLWHAETARESLTLRGHTGPVLAVAFSPDGKRIVSGSYDRTVKLWDTQAGKEILNLKGHTGAVSSVAYSPDGKHIVSCGRGSASGKPNPGEVKVWDVETGQEALTFKGPTDWVNSVAYSPDGQRIISAHGAWDYVSELAPDRLKKFGFPEETLALLIQFPPELKVWDARTGEQTLTLKGHRSPVTSVAFSSDGKRIVSGGGPAYLVQPGTQLGEIKVWDAQTGQETLTLKGHTVRVTGISFSPDAKQIVSASPGETVKVWDLRTAQEALTIEVTNAPLTNVAYSFDGKRLVCGSPFNGHVFDVETGQQLLALEKGGGSQGPIAFSSDGKRVVMESFERAPGDPKDIQSARVLKVWDAQTGRVTLTLKGHTQAVNCVAFSPDGRWIVSGSDDGTLSVWDATTGQETLPFKGHAARVLAVAFSPDATRIVSGSDDGILRVWDRRSGEETLTIRAHPGAAFAAFSVAFSPDAKQVISGGDDMIIKIWDAETCQEILNLKGHTLGVTGVAFSADGKRIISSSLDNTVRLWDPHTGQEILSLKGHTLGVAGVALSADGKRIAMAGRDGTLKLWDATPVAENVEDERRTERAAAEPIQTSPTDEVNRKLDSRITIEFEFGTPLREALSHLGERYGMNLSLFDKEAFKSEANVQRLLDLPIVAPKMVSFKLRAALELILFQAQCSYEIRDGHVWITPMK